MGADDDRRPLAVDLLEQAHDLGGQVGVEISGRLVGQEEAGVVDDGPGDGDPLLFARGQGVGIIPDPVMEADHPQGDEDLAPELVGRRPEDLKGDADVLENPAAGDDAEVLEDDAHRPAEEVELRVREPEDVGLADADLSVGRKRLPVEELEEARLPGTARPGDVAQLAALDRQGDVGQGPGRRVVLFPDMDEFDHGPETGRL